jgi:hypothetical protein
MQFTILSITFFAALSTATHQHGQYVHQRRHGNSTSIALPLYTGGAAGGEVGPGSGVTTSVGDSTLTYTLGAGESTTVVTTTIKHTSTITEDIVGR